MEQLAGYVLRVICAAMVVAIICTFTDRKSPTGALVKLVGGIFLVVTIAQSVLRMDVSKMLSGLELTSCEAQAAAQMGKNLSSEALRNIIKTNTEAYILDKARYYRVNLEVDVSLSSDEIPVPVSVTLRGAVSPYAKTQLQQIIAQDLAIPKEDQIWIG